MATLRDQTYKPLILILNGLSVRGKELLRTWCCINLHRKSHDMIIACTGTVLRVNRWIVHTTVLCRRTSEILRTNEI